MIRYRPMREDEIDLLDDFLYLAIHQEDSADPLPRAVTRDPELAVYVEGWGRPGDLCLVAVDGDDVLGAAWARVFSGERRGYGTVDARTPELSVSVVPERRGRGIGGELLRRLLGLLGARGDERASLSVHRSNPALCLYRGLGFTVQTEHEGECVMVVDLRDRAAMG